MLAYRFPADLPSQWEAELEVAIERIRKNNPDVPEEKNMALQACKLFLEDFRQVLTPLKARAVYYFDPTGKSDPVEDWLRWYDGTEKGHWRKNEPYEDDMASFSYGTEQSHWKSAPFPEVKAWVDQKITELIEKGDRLQAECNELIKCKSVKSIEVETGMYEPVYQYRYAGGSTDERIPLQKWVPGLSTRTVQDMINEMAGELMNLPRYTAYCMVVKEVNGEQVVGKYRLQPYPLIAVNNEQLADSASRNNDIIAKTRSLYCKEREVVKQEITARRKELMKREQKKALATSDEDED